MNFSEPLKACNMCTYTHATHAHTHTVTTRAQSDVSSAFSPPPPPTLIFYSVAAHFILLLILQFFSFCHIFSRHCFNLKHETKRS